MKRSTEARFSLKKIVSGGQTGADRAALDAALFRAFPCGGWCPEGRLAEDGPLSSVYPLEELSGGGYRERTIKNVENSDGTAIFYFNRPTGGTEFTLVQCIRLDKPYQLIDAAETSPIRASEILRLFTEENGITVLNVAGPRESGASGTYAYVREVILSLIEESHG